MPASSTAGTQGTGTTSSQEDTLAAPPGTPISATVSPAPTPGVPTRIVAPAISLDAPVVEIGWAPSADGSGTEWQLPDNAAGYQYGSAPPGQPGNTVISGHHNIKGKVFARLHELVQGDQVDLYVGSQVYHYRVDDSFILPERGMPTEQRLEECQLDRPYRRRSAHDGHLLAAQRQFLSRDRDRAPRVTGKTASG